MPDKEKMTYSDTDFVLGCKMRDRWEEFFQIIWQRSATQIELYDAFHNLEGAFKAFMKHRKAWDEACEIRGSDDA